MPWLPLKIACTYGGGVFGEAVEAAQLHAVRPLLLVVKGSQ